MEKKKHKGYKMHGKTPPLDDQGGMKQIKRGVYQMEEIKKYM